MRYLFALAGLAMLAAALSACGGSDSGEVERLQLETAQATESAQRAQLLAALEPLDPLRYHHLDQVIRAEQRIPAEAVIWARRASETISWVDWPIELIEHVEQYAAWLDSLLAAFRNDDADAAAEPSRIVHALAHTFESALKAWLNNESLPAVPELAGLEPPMHEDGHHEGHGDHGG